MSNRKVGFYWIKFNEDGDWDIAYYNGDETMPWSLIGSDDIFDDDELFKIDETPVTRRYY